MGLNDKIKGKGEEMRGKITHDKPMEMKGKARQLMAKAEDKMDDMTDKPRPTL